MHAVPWARLVLCGSQPLGLADRMPSVLSGASEREGEDANAARAAMTRGQYVVMVWGVRVLLLAALIGLVFW